MREHNDESFEFEVSVIGLGAMGTIMAQALLRQGRRVAIWNRSPGKAAALVAAGAHLCESAEAALAASRPRSSCSWTTRRPTRCSGCQV